MANRWSPKLQFLRDLENDADYLRHVKESRYTEQFTIYRRLKTETKWENVAHKDDKGIQQIIYINYHTVNATDMGDITEMQLDYGLYDIYSPDEDPAWD
jgi:hypothetical protein